MPLTPEEKLLNNFFANNSFKRTIVVKANHVIVSRTEEPDQRPLQMEETERSNREARRVEEDASKKREKQVAAYREQFEKEVLDKYLGAGGRVTMLGNTSIGSVGIGDKFTFHYTIGFLQGKTAAGKDVTQTNIDERREVDFGEELAPQRSLGLGM